jgi:anthranilate 3-monooxygenase (FAD) / 4-hydroxyphenylacetate 3-monooxygenase
MATRDGKQFVDRLRRFPREVWIEGKRVTDVTAHPAFRRSVQQLARLYDMQQEPGLRDALTFTVPETRERAGAAFMPARTLADLKKRREAYRLWAEATFGLMGRSPDFLNVTLLAFAEARSVFGRGGERYAQNVQRYYEYVRDNDLFLSHALIAPQNDRSKASSGQTDTTLHLKVVQETSEGIVVAGARMLATLGPVSDEMIIYNLPMFRPGDEDHAVMFAVPTHTKGLRQICRTPYDRADQSSFDHPLASRFEEADALLGLLWGWRSRLRERSKLTSFYTSSKCLENVLVTSSSSKAHSSVPKWSTKRRPAAMCGRHSRHFRPCAPSCPLPIRG